MLSVTFRLIIVGSYKHGGRRGPSYNATKDATADGSPNLSEGKLLKRVSTGYSSHEVCFEF